MYRLCQKLSSNNNYNDIFTVHLGFLVAITRGCAQKKKKKKKERKKKKKKRKKNTIFSPYSSCVPDVSRN